MPIEVSDEDAQALGVADKSTLAQYLEKFETDRTRARQAVIDKKDGDLRAFTDLGLTPDQIKALKDAPASSDEKDIEKRIQKAIDDANAATNAANKERSDARARSGEIRAQAAELGFIKPAQALALVDAKELAKVNVTDDGDADQAAVKKLLEDLAKESPHLLKPTDTTADHRTAGIGASGSDARSDVRPGADRIRSAYANTTK